MEGYMKAMGRVMQLIAPNDESIVKRKMAQISKIEPKIIGVHV